MHIIKKILFLALLLLMTTACKKTSDDVYPTNAGNLSVETTKAPETTVPIVPAETVKPTDESAANGPSGEGVWYEIFVRSFADGNGDGVGDFVGLTQKLDYLNDGNPDTTTDLGINGIWLMPINTSPSYHGYDVTDYYAIDPEYGTLEEFQTFLDEAHKRGIAVIMDLVVNHSGSGHPWFKEAKADVNSEYREYYTFITGETEGYDLNQQAMGHKVWNKAGDAYYYAIFWDQMPDLNFSNQKVRDEISNIGQFWLEQGIDGFRMDAAMHIFGLGENTKGTQQLDLTAAWWAEFDAACREVNPDYYLVGEVWDDLAHRALYSENFDSLFNFDLSEDAIIGMAKFGVDMNSSQDGFVKAVEKSYTKLESINPNFIDAPFLTNHDQRRSMEYFGADNMNSMKLAANILFTIPGNPFIYYGEEIGMLGDKPDERIREPLLWGESDSLQTSWESNQKNKETVPIDLQEKDDASLLNHYKNLIALRQGNAALLKGDFVGIETTSKSIIAFSRSFEESTIYVIHNLADEPMTFDMAELPTEMMNVIYFSNEFEFAKETTITIPAKTTLIFE